jgi:hypothetical protein
LAEGGEAFGFGGESFEDVEDGLDAFFKEAGDGGHEFAQGFAEEAAAAGSGGRGLGIVVGHGFSIGDRRWGFDDSGPW